VIRSRDRVDAVVRQCGVLAVVGYIRSYNVKLLYIKLCIELPIELPVELCTELNKIHKDNA
jgi:hypothetical protein